MRGGAFYAAAFTVFPVALPHIAAILAGGIPCLGAEILTASAANDAVGEVGKPGSSRAFGTILGNLSLNHLKNLNRHYGGMGVFHVILRNLALVFHHFLGQEILAEGLLETVLGIDKMRRLAVSFNVYT
jgi:hypothetical protein